MFISKVSIVPLVCIIVSLVIAISHLKDNNENTETAYTPENMIKPEGKEMLIHNRSVAFMHIVFSVINIIPILFFNDIIKAIFSIVVLALGFFAGSVLSYCRNRKTYKNRIDG